MDELRQATDNGTKRESVLVSQVYYDERYYPRAAGCEDSKTVEKYTDALLAKVGFNLPPICVVSSPNGRYRYCLLDGLHRLRAYETAGRESIPAIVEHLPESKWLSRAAELNIKHGLALSVDDKALVLEKLEDAGWKHLDIAELLNVRIESLEIIRGNCELYKARYPKMVKSSVKAPATPRGTAFVGTANAVQTNPYVGTSVQQPKYTSIPEATSRTLTEALDELILMLPLHADSLDGRTTERIRNLAAIIDNLPMWNHL